MTTHSLLPQQPLSASTEVSAVTYVASDNGEIDKLAVLQEVNSSVKVLKTVLAAAQGPKASYLRQEVEKIENFVARVAQPQVELNLVTDAEEEFREQREQIQAIAARMREAVNPDALLDITVAEVCQQLQVDRAVLYRFLGENKGVVLAESLASNDYTPMLKEDLPALTFGKSQLSAYREPVALGNSVRGGLSPYQLQLWDRFQIASSLSLPVVVEGRQWGLLVVQQCANSRQWREAEINLLYQVTTELVLCLKQFDMYSQQQYQQGVDRIVDKTIEKIRQAVDLDALFKTTAQEVRQLLKCDRVSVFRFNPDWSGEYVAESVATGWTPLVGPGLKTVWEDTYIQDTQGGRYRLGETFAVEDIHTAGHSPCHVEILEQFEVRAYVIVPIFVREKLWGLLAVYQNTGPRQWKASEISGLAQVGLQFGLAVQQTGYKQQLHLQTTITQITEKIRQSSQIFDVLSIVMLELRQLLNCDRVGLYQLYPDWSGEFVAESVGAGWVSLVQEQERDGSLKTSLMDSDRCVIKDYQASRTPDTDTYLKETKGGLYSQGMRFRQVDDVSTAGFSPCYLATLEKFQAKAYINVPIFQGDKLWGLLAAYQNSGSRQWDETEVNTLLQIALQIGIALQQSQYVEALRAQAERLEALRQRDRAITKIVDRIRQVKGSQPVLRSAVQEIRQLLKCDRVGVYKFHPDWSGQFIAESVASGWTSILEEQQQNEILSEGTLDFDRCTAKKFGHSDVDVDTYLKETRGGAYARGAKFTRVDDIYAMDFNSCYIERLEMYQARAYIIVPIFKKSQMWGILAVYQNSGPRQWEEADVNALLQIAPQLGVMLEQTEYLEQLNAQSQELAAVAARERAAKENLQREMIQVLSAVRPALQGDLTVRAPITETEVGTIADLYNNTLESLRELVMKVQAASQRVAQTSQSSEPAVIGLTAQAQKQVQTLTEALGQVQSMASVTEDVVANAQQVELAAQQANETVEQGDAAMDRTVEGILTIRETVAETAKKIKRLSESSQRISRVVNLIGDFASQTQMLALNAAIEATRAGEYGRGFAVVADEVRSLARQSASATTDIEQLVQEIQAGTAEVSTAMETGIQQVVEGTNLVTETRQKLNAIVDGTTKIINLVGKITQVTQVQIAQFQSVTQAVTDVSTIAEQTSSDSVDLSKSFKELLEMAQALQSSVSQFKVH